MRSSTLKQFYSWQVWIWFLAFQSSVMLHFISHSVRNAITYDHTSLSAEGYVYCSGYRNTWGPAGCQLAYNIVPKGASIWFHGTKLRANAGKEGKWTSLFPPKWYKGLFFSPIVSLEVSLENTRTWLVPGMWPSFQLLFSMTERDCCSWCYYKLCSNWFSFPFP